LGAAALSAGDPAQADRIRELMALMAEQQRLFGNDQPLTVDDPKPGDVTVEHFR